MKTENLRPFVHVLELPGDKLWSNDPALWEAAYPGLWDAMRAAYEGKRPEIRVYREVADHLDFARFTISESAVRVDSYHPYGDDEERAEAGAWPMDEAIAYIRATLRGDHLATLHEPGPALMASSSHSGPGFSQRAPVPFEEKMARMAGTWVPPRKPSLMSRLLGRA